jgi:hypothetical protein
MLSNQPRELHFSPGNPALDMQQWSRKFNSDYDPVADRGLSNSSVGEAGSSGDESSSDAPSSTSGTSSSSEPQAQGVASSGASSNGAAASAVGFSSNGRAAHLSSGGGISSNGVAKAASNGASNRVGANGTVWVAAPVNGSAYSGNGKVNGVTHARAHVSLGHHTLIGQEGQADPSTSQQRQQQRQQQQQQQQQQPRHELQEEIRYRPAPLGGVYEVR